MTPLAPHGWELPARHPHLCTGENREAFLRQPYVTVTCPVCERQTTGHPANCSGGGRVGRHYRPDIHDAIVANRWRPIDDQLTLEVGE